jgi:hypothetical protein
VGWSATASLDRLSTVIVMATTLAVLIDKVLSMVFLIVVLSGCSSVISDSEQFYKDRLRRPINWREYMTD